MTTQVLNAADATAIERPSTKVVTRWSTAAARVALGLVFFGCGLTWFLNLVPPPSEPMSDGAMALAGGFMKAGYMFPLIKGIEVVAGLLLLSNRFVALALAILAPLVVNIVAFHAFLAPSGLGMALFVLALEIGLAWAYRSTYRPMLAMRLARSV